MRVPTHVPIINLDIRFWICLAVLWPTVKVLEAGERVYTCVRSCVARM